MPHSIVLIARQSVLWTFAAIAILAPFGTRAADFTSTQTITRIAFGSCSSPEVAQPIWSAVEDAAPDIWIWTGDVIYADTTDIRRHRKLYDMQSNYPRYQDFRDERQVLGTWDDHDYGKNNSGKEYPIKELSQSAFLDFLEEPSSSPRRDRKGVYASYLYGTEDERLKIILLDVRYHRDPPGSQADILGSDQWEWLESEIKSPDADLVLLVSATVVTTFEHRGEKWADYPLAKERMLKAIRMSPVPVVLISGDLHFAEISKTEDSSLQWPLLEVTSSGMTHSSTGAYYKSSIRTGHIYYGLNFGLIEIDWGNRSNEVSLQVRDADGLARAAYTTVFKKSDEN